MSIWPSPTETMGMGMEGLGGPSGLGCSGIIEGGVQIWAPARRLTRGAPPDWRDIIGPEGEKAVAMPAIAARSARRTILVSGSASCDDLLLSCPGLQGDFHRITVCSELWEAPNPKKIQTDANSLLWSFPVRGLIHPLFPGGPRIARCSLPLPLAMP